MDFHTLSRRDLQALCKKNKIPANLTNLAMADALQALQNVEGLEEVLAHPATETPAKSTAATPSVYRASNRQKTVKEEPETSKLTKSRAKVPMAQSTLKNPENGTVRAYSTRRSTRLLEKQMDQMSIKENESMVDAKAILEKDSQDMQRQFSQDMDNSLAPDNETFSDKSDVTKEVTEEPNMVDVSVQHMDVVLKKEAGDLDNAGVKNEEPNLVEIPVQNMDENSLPFEPSMKLKNSDVHLENASNHVEESIEEKECCKGDDEVQPMQEDANDLEETNNMNGVDAAHDASSPPITMNDDHHIVLGSESNATDVLIMQEAVVEQLVVGLEEIGSSDIPCNDVSEDDDAEAAQSDSGEFDFLSDLSSDIGSDKSEDVDQPLVAPEPLLDGDMANGFGNIKHSESAEQDNEVKDNMSSSKNSARKQLGTLQEENMSFAAAGTPIEKKSLRQLKKMVKEIRHKKQQAVEKPAPTPLQVHKENV